MRRIVLIVYLAAVALAFSVVFTIATLAGASISPALAAGGLAAITVAAATIVGLLPTTIVHEDRLTIAAPRERVYAAIADPRPGPRRTPGILAVEWQAGEPGAVGSRWRTTSANGAVFAAEVVAADPPARLLIRMRSVPRGPQRRVVIETERTLEATPVGTELTVRSAMRTVLVARLIERLQRSQAARLRHWTNDRLREELEPAAGTAPAAADRG